MDIVLGIIKWVVNAVMILALFFGILYSYVFGNVSGQVMPSSPSDLVKIHVTVKEIDDEKDGQVIVPNEYFAKFKSDKVHNLEKQPGLIKSGDGLDVYLSKIDASLLKLSPASGKAPASIIATNVYGIALNDGAFVVDPKDTLAGNAGMGSLAHGLLKKTLWMIYVPVAYFIVLIVLFFVRRKKKQSKLKK